MLVYSLCNNMLKEKVLLFLNKVLFAINTLIIGKSRKTLRFTFIYEMEINENINCWF